MTLMTVSQQHTTEEEAEVEGEEEAGGKILH
jgi:hypothetical protein